MRRELRAVNVFAGSHLVRRIQLSRWQTSASSSFHAQPSRSRLRVAFDGLRTRGVGSSCSRMARYRRSMSPPLLHQSIARQGPTTCPSVPPTPTNTSNAAGRVEMDDGRNLAPPRAIRSGCKGEDAYPSAWKAVTAEEGEDGRWRDRRWVGYKRVVDEDHAVKVDDWLKQMTKDVDGAGRDERRGHRCVDARNDAIRHEQAAKCRALAESVWRNGRGCMRCARRPHFIGWKVRRRATRSLRLERDGGGR